MSISEFLESNCLDHFSGKFSGHDKLIKLTNDKVVACIQQKALAVELLMIANLNRHKTQK